MRHFAIDPPAPARHARLFELIRQQDRAARVAERLARAPVADALTLARVAARAAASWSKVC
ncbi:hypothetical protein [Roseovarius aquimarinus]|uniref:Uncharacterized protein n=1 Tax=Roseovarius aquimarinus TaxID=1229156 RepID=A0ABW7I365_9RHOB